jgi:hypothetical protein
LPSLDLLPPGCNANKEVKLLDLMNNVNPPDNSFTHREHTRDEHAPKKFGMSTDFPESA